jgi:hypothetical protein
MLMRCLPYFQGHGESLSWAGVFFSAGEGRTYRVPELDWLERPYAPFDLKFP